MHFYVVLFWYMLSRFGIDRACVCCELLTRAHFLSLHPATGRQLRGKCDVVGEANVGELRGEQMSESFWGEQSSNLRL